MLQDSNKSGQMFPLKSIEMKFFEVDHTSSLKLLYLSRYI